MSWQQKNLGPPIPPEAQAIVDNLSTAAGSVVPILDAAAALLDIAKVFYNGGSDLYAALMSALITECENLINDLFGSGAYEIIVSPFHSIAQRLPKDKYGINLLNPGQAIDIAIKSFDDLGDDNRPQFSSGANVSAFGILVTVPDVFLFIQLLEALYNVWTTWDINYIRQEILKKTGVRYKSKPPDWGNVSFTKIDALAQIKKQLMDVLYIAKGYQITPDDGINDLINALSRKVAILNDTVTTFQAVLDALAGSTALSGAYIFDVPLGVGGNDKIKAALPNEVLSALKLNRYTIFMLYVGGGPSAAGVDAIRQLIV